MKIGIVTYTHGTNFGQRLQNYALQTVLENMGHKVYTLQQTLPFGIKGRIKNYLLQIEYILIPQYNKSNEKKRRVVFKKFNRKYICFYSRKLRFNGKNTWVKSKFDAFIVGSDQIWSPLSCYVGDNSFLKFADDNQKMTYAPSFSVTHFPQDKEEYYHEALLHFRYLSIREDRGAEIIRELTGQDAKVVVDPTLLLDKNDWNLIRKKCSIKPSVNYILEMFIGSLPSDIQEVECKYECSILRVDSNTPISPDDFIDIVADASLVLTDSFHATVFSAIYHVPFINYSRSEIGDVMNSRFDTLYRILGVESRQWSNMKQKSNYSMDFGEIDNNICIEKQKSFQFLQEELNSL